MIGKEMNPAIENSYPYQQAQSQNLLSPLLSEYEAAIRFLQGQLDSYKEELKELKLQCERLVEENQNLSEELKNTIHAEVDSMDTQLVQEKIQDHEIVNNLHQQVLLLAEEKDSAVDLWHMALQEIEKLEHQLQELRENPALKVVEFQALKMKEEYNRVLTTLTTELDTVKNQLGKTKNEGHTAQIQIAELRKTLETLRGQLVKRERNLNESKQVENSNQAVIDEQQKTIRDQENKLSHMLKEVERIKIEKDVLEDQLAEQQKRNADLENKELDAVVQMRDTLQMAENALLEKDQTLVREQQLTQEIQRLKNSLSQLLEEAGARTKKEVDSIRIQCNTNLAKLMEEIQNLELETSEKQAQLERALREKKAAESELEKIYQDVLSQGNMTGKNHDDFSKRLNQLERSKDDALRQVESLKHTLNRLNLTNNQEKNHSELEKNQLKERLTILLKECEHLSEEKLALTNDTDQLKKKVLLFEKEKDLTRRKLLQQVIQLEQDLKLKEREFEARLESVEESHQHSMGETHRLLSAQQHMSIKWKEESQLLTQKFERKILDLRSNLQQYELQIDELISCREDNKEKINELEQTIIEYANTNNKLQSRVKDLEKKLMQSSEQLTRQLKREQKIIHDYLLMEQALGKSQLEHNNDSSRDELLKELMSSKHEDLLSHYQASHNFSRKSSHGLDFNHLK